MLDLDVAIEGEFGFQAAETVFERAVGPVVDGGDVLQLNPGHPAGRETALGSTGLDDLLGEFLHFGPGLGCRVTVEARLLEDVLVEVHDGRRRIERQRQDVAFGIRIVARYRREEGRGLPGLAGFLHELVDRLHGALGRHHRAGADFEDLDDGRLFLGAEGCDRSRQRFGVGALVGRHDPVFALALVEGLGDGFQLLAELGIHRMPPADLGRGERRGSGHGCCERGE